MNSQNLAFVSMALENKLNKQDTILTLRQFEDLNDDAFTLFSTITFKSPLMGLLLHWVLGFFGAGRFYKGDVLQGVLYIVASVVIFVLFVGGVILEEESGDETLLGISMLLLCIYLVIFIVDYYLIYKGIQKDNFAKIQQFLLFNKG